MTAKEYLEQLTDIDMRIRSMRRHILLCEERATATQATISQMPTQTHGGGGKVETNICEKIDTEALLPILIAEFEAFKKRAIMEIHAVHENIYATLLMEKYVNGESWEMVAEILDKDVDYVRKELHSKALAAFEETTPENTRKNPVIPMGDVLE